MNCTALPCASGTALLDLTLEHDALQHHILCLSACLPACGGELDIHATAMTWLPSPCSMSRQLPHLLMQDPPHRQLPASPQSAPAAPRQQQMLVPKADTDMDIGTDTDLDGTHRMRPASYGGPRTSSAPSAAPAPCSGWHVGAHRPHQQSCQSTAKLWPTSLVGRAYWVIPAPRGTPQANVPTLGALGHDLALKGLHPCTLR